MRRPGVLTKRGQLFLTIGALAMLVGVVLGYPDVTRVGALLVALPLLTALLARRTPPALRVARTVTPRRLTPDERGRVEVEFVNVGRRDSGLYLAEEHLDYALGDRPRFLLPRMSPGERRRLRYPVRSRYRGVYSLGPITLRQRDPFGLTHVAMRLTASTEVLVLPRIFDLQARRMRGQGRGTEGELPQMVALHGEDDVSIRQYRDGDELRRVHWPATAHRGEIMVRQEDRPTRRRAILLLDSRENAHPGSSFHPSYEWAISALASVARHLVADGFVVHLLTDGSVRDGTAAHQIDLDDALAALARIDLEPTDSLEQLCAAAHTFTSGGVLVVAAVVGHDDDELRELAHIRELGSSAYAFVLDPWAFGRGSAQPQATPAAGVGRVLSEAGWQVAPVGPATTVASAWGELSRSGARVGR